MPFLVGSREQLESAPLVGARHAYPLRVAHAQVMHRIRLTLLGRQPKPADGLGRVLIDPLAEVVADAHGGLREWLVPFTRRAGEPVHRGRRVALDALAALVAQPQVELRLALT